MRFGIYLIYTLAALVLDATAFPHSGEIKTNSLTESVPIVWIVGGPGSGKGTQCAKIVEKFGFNHFSVGDLLRTEVAAGTEKGKEYAKLMEHGGLLTAEESTVLLQNAMNKELKHSKGFLIDGFPRDTSQGPAFEKAIAPADLIISLECKPETLIARIQERVKTSEKRRDDDNETTIKKRIETYTKNAEAILNQYSMKTKRIDGERDIDSVFVDVSQAISQVLSRKSKEKKETPYL